VKRLILLHTLLFSLVAHAILDTNNNGLSDLWEKQYNNGNLFSNTFLPTADPDIDGWNNRTEAAAGTDPFLANSPEGIVATTLLPSATTGTYTLTWPTRIGKRYQLQASTDMESWLSVGDSIIAENTSHSIGINVTQPGSPTPPKLFWHILIDDIDSDIDGLTNNEEHALATNPNASDSDGDTLLDGWEVAYGINPNDDGTVNASNGASGDPDNDGSINSVEQNAGSSPTNTASTPSDIDGDTLLNNQDADPNQILIDWERAPKVSYAVIDLSMEPLNSFAPPHGRLPVAAVLNDHGEVTREPDPTLDERTPSVWTGINYPVVWSLLQDYVDVNDNVQEFSDDFSVSFNNVGNVYHGLHLDNGFNGAPGIQTVAVLWNDMNSVPALYGNHPFQTPISRSVISRFDKTAVDLRESNYPAFDHHTKNITAGDFVLTDTSDDIVELPSLRAFNFYSHAPSITRTGKILVYQDELFKVNDVPAPEGAIYGLTADPLDRDMIAILAGNSPAGISTLRYRNNMWETMPMPGIMDMNESGTAITFPDHQVWINGETIILDVLLDYSGWSQFKAEQINEDGLILGSAMPDEGTAHKAVLLVPLNFDVYPPEPTAEEITAAGNDYWEVETFQNPADDPQFWIQANIMVPGKDDEGRPMMVPAEDGTEVTWEIDADVSDSGATLSSSTTLTENGHTAVMLTTSTVPRDRFKITAKLTTLKWKTGADGEVATYTDEDGFHKIKTQFFEVVPGNVNSIAVTASASSMPADEASEIVLQAVLTDSEGNPAARGTDVNWHVSGGGSIKIRDHLVSEENGIVSATVVSGSVVGLQKITVEADGVVGEIIINNTAVQVVSMTPSVNSLDIASGQSATITLQTNGVADGAEVTWKTSSGTLLEKSATVLNNTAHSVLRADAGVTGNAVVWATVGDAISHCDVAFTSSAIASIEVAQPILVYDEATDGVGTVPTLAGGTENISYYANSNVTIRSPGNPGAWATVSFTGSSGLAGHAFPFEVENNQLSPSDPVGANATLANGALIDTEQSRTGSGALSLPTSSATSSIPHDASLSLTEGSRLRFSLRPTENSGNVFSKQSEYSVALLEDGKLKFTLGSGQNATEVTSAWALSPENWHDVSISLNSGHLMMEIAGSLTSVPLASPPPAAAYDLIIGGCIAHLDDLRFVHHLAGFQGISMISTGLNAQNQVQLDGNGVAVIQVRPQMLGQGPPPGILAQTVDVQVQVANQNVAAKNALTVTDKGSAVLIKAIGGQTSYIGTDVSSATDRAKLVGGQLRAAVSVADRTGAIPDDMGADAVARGEAGYLIAIWMEETVDEAGMVHPLMSVSAQNLPDEIAQTLNWMLAEMMVSAGQRDSSQSFSDYIRKNKKELLLALEALSAGDEEKFLAIAGVVDGEEGFANASAVAQQVGQGVVQAMAKSSLETVGNAYDSLRAWVDKQNWSIELRDRHEAGQAARKLQKSVIEAVAGTAANSKEVIKNCSDYLLQEELIDPEGAAALGFAYGVVEAIDELGQDVAQPELLAQTAMQLADLTISAVGGDAQAKEALKEIGSLAVMMPINAIPETKDLWDQGNYFQAGASSVAVVEVALVAKFVKDIAVKSTRKALRWGRHRTTDWQASIADIGFKAESLAYQRLKKKGFTDIVPIRNASNHGIDWVCRDKNGGIVFIEVKGHRLDAAPRLSRSQKDMKAFAEDRLNKAVLGVGHWANVSDETIDNAKRLLNDIRLKKTPVTGYVINVDYAVSKFPKIKYYEWLNGVGNLVNPAP